MRHKILTSIFFATIINYSNGKLNSSKVSEGRCLDEGYINSDFQGNPLFAFQRNKNWFVPMMSEYGARHTAEVFLGRPAKNREELLSMNPRAIFPYINASDTDGNSLLIAYNRHFKAQCGFDNTLKLQFSCECRNSFDEKFDEDDDDDYSVSDQVDCSRVGTFGVNIFKIDEKNQFLLLAVCPKQKRIYWYALTQKVPVPEETIKIIKDEIKKTRVFKKEYAIVLDIVSEDEKR